MSDSPLVTDLHIDAVGYQFETPYREVREHDVQLFAALTGDRHPQHVDQRWASASLFGEQIAHGLLVVSFAMGLVPMDAQRVLALRRCEALFKQPVKFGDTIKVIGQLSDVKPLGDQNVLAKWRWRVVNGDLVLVVRLVLDVLWRNLGTSAEDPHDLRVPGVVPL
jgi:3-hydroxybutyryl-CoA dehydratase